MPCPHRFLNLHQPGLFPNWEIKHLFIGTFNPSWDHPYNNADYFYGRSTYFWKVLPRFFDSPNMSISTEIEKINFCKHFKIGFTDLIINVENADINNPIHRERILSFRDRDLLKFNNGLIFQTQEIIQYIKYLNSIESVFFTLLGDNVGLISEAISEIERKLFNVKPVHRLHTHTGQGLRSGIPRENKLTHKWYAQGMNQINPNLDLAQFYYS